MRILLIVLFSAWFAVFSAVAETNVVARTTNISSSTPDGSDPVDKEYRKLMMDDDAAQNEVDRWIKDNNQFAKQGAGESASVLNARIHKRFEPVKKGYQDFIAQHPDHVGARLAYGSFLTDIQEEGEAIPQFEKARELDPKNPTPWNQLANHYGHDGPTKKAFEYYEKAIELDPSQAVYYQNMATTVYLFRKDAMEYYKVDEQGVFNKALGLYQKAVKLDPNNFQLAEDYAMTYYGIRPTRDDEALRAWTNAMNLTDSPVEKEGIQVHLARWCLNAGRFTETHQHLNLVTNEVYLDLKNRLLRNLKNREEHPEGTNTPTTKIELESSTNKNNNLTAPNIKP